VVLVVCFLDPLNKYYLILIIYIYTSLSYRRPLSPNQTDLSSFTARFNSRTGQFTPATARQPGHLSEHERAKRMSEFYFDVEKWEEDLARRGGRLMGEEDDPADEEGTKEKKRKRPSKKDLVCRFFLRNSFLFLS
jgi:hypothetical protein